MYHPLIHIKDRARCRIFSEMLCLSHCLVTHSLLQSPPFLPPSLWLFILNLSFLYLREKESKSFLSFAAWSVCWMLQLYVDVIVGQIKSWQNKWCLCCFALLLHNLNSSRCVLQMSIACQLRIKPYSNILYSAKQVLTEVSSYLIAPDGHTGGQTSTGVQPHSSLMPTKWLTELAQAESSWGQRRALAVR